MQLVDCPHCYTSVVPNDEGICPACRKNVHETSGTDLSRASISISMRDVLPDVCYHCGCPTEQSIYVIGKRSSDDDAPSPLVALLTTVASFVLLPFTIIWNRTSETAEVSLHLPQCEACAASAGKPNPEFVNFQQDSMTFIVDKQFKQALQEQRNARQET